MRLNELPDWVRARVGMGAGVRPLLEIQDKALKRHRQQIRDDSEKSGAEINKRLDLAQGAVMADFPTLMVPPLDGDVTIRDGVSYDFEDDRPDFVKRDEKGWV